MNIKRNIIFALEGRKKNGVAITENVPIRMRVNYSGQRIEFQTQKNDCNGIQKSNLQGMPHPSLRQAGRHPCKIKLK